jgi:Brp/Blh family beta-carotene 15,15'-monooxygenase
MECTAALALGLALPPLWFFTIYFCGLHSPRHLIAHWPQVRAQRPRWTAILVLSGYTAGTVVVAVAASVLIESAPLNGTAPLVRLLFIGLAALTVPHMALLFYLHWKNQ